MNVDDLAKRRDEMREGFARHFAEDAERIGLVGEDQFSDETGLPLDDEERPEGDGGYDFVVELTVDVKTFRKPYNLLVEEGKVDADIYVLARYVDDAPATLLGWQWAKAVLAAPTRDFGYGVPSHYIPAHRLKPMEPLLRLGRRTAKRRASA